MMTTVDEMTETDEMIDEMTGEMTGEMTDTSENDPSGESPTTPIRILN